MQSLVKKRKLSAKVVSTILLGSLLLSNFTLNTSFGTRTQATGVVFGFESESDSDSSIAEESNSEEELEIQRNLAMRKKLQERKNKKLPKPPNTEVIQVIEKQDLIKKYPQLKEKLDPKKIRKSKIHTRRKKLQQRDSWLKQADCSWYGISTGVDTYSIGSPQQLAGLAKLVNEGNSFENKTINLTANINLKDYDWVPIGCSETRPFKGTFNANNYSIFNMQIVNSEICGYIGLFGYIENASIKGVNLRDEDYINSVGFQAVGGIVGLASNNSTIDSCNNYSKICSTYSAAGIVSRLSQSKVINCANYGEIRLKEQLEGSKMTFIVRVAGISETVIDNSKVINCANYANITNEYNINDANKSYKSCRGSNTAGIAAIVSSSEVRGCINCGDIFSRAKVNNNVGGIIGSCNLASSALKSYCLWRDAKPPIGSQVGGSVTYIETVSEDQMKTIVLGELNKFVTEYSNEYPDIKLVGWTIAENHNGYPALLNNI